MISSLYLLLGLIALVCSLLVVSSLSPINRLVMLIVVYLAGSLMYTLLDFYFLGLTFIVVYVGAIAILFLFVIMMIPVHIDLAQPDTHSTAYTALALGIISLVLAFLVFSSFTGHSAPNGALVSYFYPSWATAFVSFTDVHTLGYMIYLAYPVSLILIGLTLWVTLIGIIPLSTI